MPRPIIIDTDPGQDDAVALLLALAAPEELDVRGITTVAGNVPLELTTRNALMMVELAGRPDIAVYAGCDRPMVRDLITAEYVHGKTGIDGADTPPPRTTPADQHAVEFIIETCRATPGITLCTLGPLTNMGTALEQAPDIAGTIAQLVLMGGGFFEGGNTTPAAEFNIYVDPQAAALVFGSGIDLVMMPLDVTHRALTSDARVDAFRDLGTASGAAVAGMLEFFERYDMERYGTEGAPLHDPTVIAYLLEPGIFDGRRCRVDIETASELTMGMTVVDWWGLTTDEPNCFVVHQIDDERFFALLTERIGLLP
ncbi:MAG: nucleoside hydrolase [Acidimicrobiia bacterium]|nr:nucleoside hydrolase [Acidimicrobiia bacterium]MBT8216647.1 nucleoside hydrolase [Acidimicrobiia bacterium]NNF10635.1 nucleoside hydrolase [Acidimicrobiia bacterium]NNL70813.1 nucleoside hydrolase [Acidimicrobiia bacterium]